MGVFESATVRWAIAVGYLVVSLLLLIVLGDLPRVDQVVVTVTVLIGFLILPSVLKEYAEQS